VIASGGLANRFTNRDAIAAQLSQSDFGGDTVSLFLVARLPAALCVLTLYLVAREFRFRKNTNSKWRLRAIWIALLSTIIVNPFSSPRFIALSALVAVILGLFDLKKVSTKSIFALGTLLGMGVIYPLSAWFKKESFQTQGVSLDLTTFTSIDFDGFQMSLNSVIYTAAHGIQWGVHVLASFFFWVPRSIWPSKAFVSTYAIADSRGYSWGNLSLPLWSELYLDLGVLGCVLGLYLIGKVSRKLDFDFVTGGRLLPVAAAYGATQWALLRGPLGGSMVFVGTAILLGLLLLGGEKHEK